MEKMPERYTVTAVVDSMIERCRESQERWKCDTYNDYRRVFRRNDVDLVINALPSDLHVPVTREGLQAGFNVLCEKPLARRVRDVDLLIALARRKRRLFAIFQQGRFAPYFREVRKVVDSGVLGRIIMIKVAFNGFARRWDWQTLQKRMAGSLLNTGPHPLDQALHFIGRDQVPKVLCIMDRVNTRGDAEDHVKIILLRKDHPTIDLEVSSCCAYPQHTYQVYGSQGGLAGNMTHLDWKYFKPSEAPRQKLQQKPLAKRLYCSEELKWHTGSWDATGEEKDLFDYMGVRFYENLYDVMTRGTRLAVTPEEVRQQIAVIEECHRQCPLSRMK
jgi:predicted dehydrogenase